MSKIDSVLNNLQNMMTCCQFYELLGFIQLARRTLSPSSPNVHTPAAAQEACYLVTEL